MMIINKFLWLVKCWDQNGFLNEGVRLMMLSLIWRGEVEHSMRLIKRNNNAPGLWIWIGRMSKITQDSQGRVINLNKH